MKLRRACPPKLQCRRGFTLIELLVVIFIVALLAALVIVNVSGSRKTARDAKRMADLKTIQGALELYNNKYGYYPTTVGFGAPPSGYHQGAPCGTGGGATRYCLDGSSDGWTGMCASYNLNDDFTSTSTNPWIPSSTQGLIPNFLSVLPQDPKPVGSGGCYKYIATSTAYIIGASQTMETCGTDCNNSESLAIREMTRPASFTAPSGATVTTRQPSILLYTSGAATWGF